MKQLVWDDRGIRTLPSSIVDVVAYSVFWRDAGEEEAAFDLVCCLEHPDPVIAAVAVQLLIESGEEAVEVVLEALSEGQVGIPAILPFFRSLWPEGHRLGVRNSVVGAS